ncbi:FAD-binding domain-containing protein [Yoonia sp. BS5-3]|uniref:FAD-binding domain-containing protein n=1 Tax=Yoonia phaeophyticola TaxID=3137369 RepID=A0ABZ2UZF1_9RHOB
MFEPSYTAALQRLQNFLPHAGRDYAARRNYDDIRGVSGLSPYLRHRIITEADVLKAVLGRHSPHAAEKFIQEVYWRTYWKGWLEMRPGIWTAYKTERDAALNRIQTEAGLRQQWEAACTGTTGIACFDHWAQELAATGYLHNHARMWFASIWIFTLRLPWTLGADFFLRHLLDGDAASNTLSWRWVGGLQTVGKTYLARPDNIAKYTNGRFQPTGLASFAAPLAGMPHPKKGPLPVSDAIDPRERIGLLITEDDLSPGWLLDQFTPVTTAFVQTTDRRSPLQVAPQVTDFVANAMKNTGRRYASRLGPVSYIAANGIDQWVAENEITQIVSAYSPVGPTQDALENISQKQLIRPYDSQAWPYATHGFFKFRERIPKLISPFAPQTTA